MKNLITVILLFLFQAAGAQTSDRLTLSFENLPLKEVFHLIESRSDLRFFYLEEWLNEDPVSGSFEDEPVEAVLQQLFSGTLLHFIILDGNKVILTRNMLVHAELPPDFFSEGSTIYGTAEENSVSKLVFSHLTASPEQQEVTTVRIGKQSRISSGPFRLRGQVTSAETGAPIPNLAVVVEAQGMGAVTDENGNYSLLLPAGVHLLETKSLITESFKKRLILYNSGSLDFQLRENLEQLGEVVLEANARQNIKEANTGVDEINVKEIRNIPLVLGERDILKVATTLPGISTAGEGAAGFNVRGGKGDQNLILLDNAVLYNPSHFFGLFSALNPFTSGEVKIYKGNIPAEFGGRLSSVFDITTRDATIEKFAGEASIGPVTGNLSLEVPVVKGRSGILVGGRTTYSDWILKSLDEESLKNSTASFYDVVGKYNHIINDKSEVELMGYYSSDAFSITSDSLYSYSNRLFSLRYNHDFSRRHRGSLILSNSNYKFSIDYESSLADNFTTNYGINESEVKLNMRYLPENKHQFTYGLSSKLYLMEPGSIEPAGEGSQVQPLSLPQEKGLESAVYLSDDFTVNEKLSINAGLRFSVFAALGEGTQNIYEPGVPKSQASLQEVVSYGENEVMETYSGLSGRISARYFLTPELSVKGSFSNMFQYIHTLTNNTTMSPTDTYKLSDSNIKPQRGNQFSLGLYRNFQENRYEVSLETYYKSSKYILDFKVGAELFMNETIETEVLQGDGKAYGVELLLKKSSGRLNGWVGYSYNRSLLRLEGIVNSDKINNGEFFPSNFDKPHDFSFVGNYKFTRRYSLSANFVYQTGRPVTVPVGKYEFEGSEYVMYSNRNEYRIPDYFRLDLSLNIEGNHKIKKLAHSFWNISVYNVLGRNNPYSVFFVTEQGEVKALQSTIFSVPVPTITYNIKF